MAGIVINGSGSLVGLTTPTTADGAMTVSAEQLQLVTAYTTGGTSIAYTMTTLASAVALTTNECWSLTFNQTCGAAPTLARDGLTAQNLKYYDAHGTKQSCTSAQIVGSMMASVIYDGTDYVVFPMAGKAASGANGDITSMSALVQVPWTGDVQDFRLTLTSGVPVTTADVTGATRIYCTPYKGKSVSLFDGTNWNVRQSAEFSIALGTLTASLPYDVFCYDNAGVPTLEFLSWLSGTARSPVLVYQDGVLCESGAVTHRYLGTFYTTATTTTEDSAANRLLFNYYNQVDRLLYHSDATVSWTYTTATPRQARGDTANKVTFIIGVSESEVDLCTTQAVENTNAGVQVIGGLGIDQITVNIHPDTSYCTIPVVNTTMTIMASKRTVFTVGYHYAAQLESSAAIGTTTWYGAGLTAIQGGLKA